MKLRLQFKTGHHAGHALEFEAPRTIILGRSSQADVQVYDERISRRHCAIRVEEAQARVKDLGSGNGTFLNRAEVRETVLADCDVLVIGHTEIEVRLIATPVPASAPAGAPTTGWSSPAAAGPAAFRAQTDAPFPAAVPHPAVRGAPGTAPPSSAGPDHGPPPGGRGALAGPPASCAFCQQIIPPVLLPQAIEHRGRWLCPRCAPRVEVPGFEIERPLGEGAMGVVYLARDLKRGGILVALKVLKSRGDMTPEDRTRFLREAETTQALDHRNIVRVLETGAAGSFLYLAMEFVQGRSLKAWIHEHGALPLPTALRIAVQVALALEHARERHVVHRDVKPENILVQDDGLAKLADFGLAKSTLNSGLSGLTRPGDGLGTLPYMPPEQIENALFADHRSDVYSFGATIYHMLTGQPPFRCKTMHEYFSLIRTEPPAPIARYRQDVPRVLEAMVEKALRKKPEERFQQVAEMLQVLQQFLHTEFDTRATAD